MAADLKKVTDIPATQGAHVTQTIGGTKGWNYDADFDFNDSSMTGKIQRPVAGLMETGMQVR